MGRKSGATKGGRTIHPTDALRKQMRKKEIKKNKKVRDVVRAAVLRSKSPYDLQGDLEVLDDQIRILKQRNDGTDRMLLPKREKAEQTLKRVLAVWKTEKPEKLDAFNAWLVNHEPKRYTGHHSMIDVSGRRGDGDGSADDDDDDLDVDFDVDAIPVPEGHAPAPARVPPPPPPRPPGMVLPPRPGMPMPMGMAMMGGMRPPPPPPGPPPRAAIEAARAAAGGGGAAGEGGEGAGDTPKTAPVFSAQAQIRDFRAEVRQFVPVSVRVKRDAPAPMKPRTVRPGGVGGSVPGRPAPSTAARAAVNPAPSVGAAAQDDDEYAKFMREMQGLL